MELTGLTPAELGALMPCEGRASNARGKAVWRWLREAEAPFVLPDRIDDLSRHALADLRAAVGAPAIAIEEERASVDGTIKWRLACRGAPVEAVLIPNADRAQGGQPLRGLRDRATVCVSSQSGCTRWCDFCATARMTFGGQLSAGEIVAQVLIARRAARVPVTNVVFMGMGEPLDNLEAVLQAIRVLDEGVGIAPRHCTVSTSGVLPRMQALWERSRASVALSLHATTQALRDRLMPRVRRWPIDALTTWMRAASAEVVAGVKPRHFFVEYTLLAGVNDGDDDAERLVALLDGIRARVNLIPFNPSPALPFARPSDERVRAFRDRVIAGGRLCIVRETRGDDALAACGQLAGARELHP